jgi:hypothetical protein
MQKNKVIINGRKKENKKENVYSKKQTFKNVNFQQDFCLNTSNLMSQYNGSILKFLSVFLVAYIHL